MTRRAVLPSYVSDVLGSADLQSDGSSVENNWGADAGIGVCGEQCKRMVIGENDGRRPLLEVC